MIDNSNARRTPAEQCTHTPFSLHLCALQYDVDLPEPAEGFAETARDSTRRLAVSQVDHSTGQPIAAFEAKALCRDRNSRSSFFVYTAVIDERAPSYVVLVDGQHLSLAPTLDCLMGSSGYYRRSKHSCTLCPCTVNVGFLVIMPQEHHPTDHEHTGERVRAPAGFSRRQLQSTVEVQRFIGNL